MNQLLENTAKESAAGLKQVLIALMLSLILLFNIKPCLSIERLPIATGEWPPYTSETMEGHGFFSEIVKEAFLEAGIAIDLSFYPWKRCEFLVETGELFAAFPYSITDHRQQFASFSDPVSKSTTVFFFNKNRFDSIEFNNFNDLKQYSIVGVLGYFYVDMFARQKLNVHYVTTEIKALELVLKDILRPGKKFEYFSPA